MASFASCHRYHVIVIIWMVGNLGSDVMMVRSPSMASLIAVAVTGSSGCLLAVLMVDANSSGPLVALSATAAAGD